MLFAVKNRFWPSLVLLMAATLGALCARQVLGLAGGWQWQPRFLSDLLLGMVVLAASDAGLHGLFLGTLKERYRSRYRALAEYFRPQGVPAIIAGGLLAGGEELVFRGVLLEGLRALAGLSAAAAVGWSALLFGLLHVLPQRHMWPFALWAAWEGALLGGVYVLSGSLAVVIVLHVLHDIAGFSVFAYQRGRWLEQPGG